MDFITPILEVVFSILAYAIYGDEKRPRHPIWRNSVRAIAFGGAALAAAGLGGLFVDFDVPVLLIVLWVVCCLIVIVGEHELGSNKIGWASFATFAALALFAYFRWS